MSAKKTPPPISRLAPTPSGYLHMGNAYNFILTWWITRWLNGKIHLRIDDADSTRRRPEFLEDIFESLQWLGLDYDFGPKNVEDFLKNHSQTKKKEGYFQTALRAQGVFACDCSRKEIQKIEPSGVYPGTCRDLEKDFKKNSLSLRMPVPENQEVEINGKKILLGKSMGDFILWRKDDIPSYQLTSVVDDREMGVNLIVRGEDLLESSACQLFLEKRLGWNHLRQSRFIHHPLLTDPEGKKLSKSQQADSHEARLFTLKSMRERGLKAKDVIEMLGKELELGESSPSNMQQLLSISPESFLRSWRA